VGGGTRGAKYPLPFTVYDFNDFNGFNDLNELTLRSATNTPRLISVNALLNNQAKTGQSSSSDLKGSSSTAAFD